MKRLVYFLIFILLITVLATVIQLVIKQWNEGDLCPLIVNIPACYIIFAGVIVAILVHANILKKIVWFYVGAGIPWLIALAATWFQFAGSVQCPKTEGGVPMCYLSLVFFSVLIVLKYVNLKQSLKR